MSFPGGRRCSHERQHPLIEPNETILLHRADLGTPIRSGRDDEEHVNGTLRRTCASMKALASCSDVEKNDSEQEGKPLPARGK
jgi:hypothetical protein